MVILIAGASHTGKTLLAQRILEKFNYPYLSLDHLKMGLIRSGNTDLTPCDDEKLTPYLWAIANEIVKTAIENEQNLVIEGCYIPFTWREDFEEEYLKNIRYLCLVMSEEYINNHFSDILLNASAIEQRGEDDFDIGTALADNARNLAMCRKYGCEFVLIDEDYHVDFEM